MKIFPNIDELLKRLYSERKLLRELFQARLRFDVTYEDALEFVDSEKNLSLLIDYGVIRYEDNLIELEENYQHFFEEVFRLNEDITSSSVEENVRSLKENIDFYLKERDHKENQDKYVRRIRRSLRNIATQAANKTIELKRVINDTYRQERNYEIKRQKLENNLATLESIANLIRSTERLIDERKDTLDVLSTDNRISRLTTDVRIQFKDIFHSLIELERTIRDYLHQIDAHNRLVKRIRKLKYLKDQLTWERTTNIRDVLQEIHHQILETTSYYSTKISLDFLRNTDDGLDVITEARKIIKRLNNQKTVSSVPLTDSEMNTGFVVEDFVDTDVIANAFFASSQDLYTFVVTYPYTQPQAKERKVEYYTEIILNHPNRLLITSEWKCDGNIEYPLIFNRP
ncbi:hypothetical protein [uncultured Duncaniella sp.]|uniref:hypothetical protein n=1 Tax=uncultured Duncaniella sp. TaxID=2768039 RepID=UPI0025D3B964|nr:hypothetical protein [uncultured Duncaniella sp.]